MKRCPQCEFIYEDEQATCDMDGKILVSDSAFALAPSSKAARKGFRLHSITLPAFAGLMLAAVLSFAYWATPPLGAAPVTPDSLTQPLPVDPILAPANKHAQAESPNSNEAVVAETKEPETSSSDLNLEHTKDLEDKPPANRLSVTPTVPPLPRLRPLPRLPRARVADRNSTSTITTTNVQKDGARQKSDSKVSSFIKKTGQLLKKPFKL